MPNPAQHLNTISRTAKRNPPNKEKAPSAAAAPASFSTTIVHASKPLFERAASGQCIHERNYEADIDSLEHQYFTKIAYEALTKANELLLGSSPLLLSFLRYVEGDGVLRFGPINMTQMKELKQPPSCAAEREYPKNEAGWRPVGEYDLYTGMTQKYLGGKTQSVEVEYVQAPSGEHYELYGFKRWPWTTKITILPVEPLTDADGAPLRLTSTGDNADEAPQYAMMLEYAKRGKDCSNQYLPEDKPTDECLKLSLGEYILGSVDWHKRGFTCWVRTRAMPCTRRTGILAETYTALHPSHIPQAPRRT